MEGLNLSKIIPWQRLIFLLIGIGLLIGMIVTYDAGQIGRGLCDIGGVYLAIIALSFFVRFLQTLAWQATLKDQKVSFWSLFKITNAHETLNLLMPFSLLGGDALANDQLRKNHEVLSGAESIVTDRGIRLVTLSLFIVAGLIIGSINETALPAAVRFGLPLLAIAALVFAIIALDTKKGSLLEGMLSKVHKLGLPLLKSPAIRGTAKETDRFLFEFYRNQSGAFFQAFFLHLLALGLFVAEVYLIGDALLDGFPVTTAWLLASVTPVVIGLFCFIPGAFGILEAAFCGLVSASFGDAGAVAGVTIVLARRIRALFWIIVGLVFAGNPFKMFLK